VPWSYKHIVGQSRLLYSKHEHTACIPSFQCWCGMGSTPLPHCDELREALWSGRHHVLGAYTHTFPCSWPIRRPQPSGSADASHHPPPPPSLQEPQVHLSRLGCPSPQVEDFTGRGLDDLKAGIIRTPLPAKDTLLDGEYHDKSCFYICLPASAGPLCLPKTPS